MKRFILFLLIVTGIAAFLTAQTAGVGSFRQEGTASWYGNEFDGKPTASGEIYNSRLYTAAHPTLEFGTYLTITNKQNNHKVTVRVNDRGPFAAARIIDLSRAAAEVLDMVTTGTAPVLVELTADTVLGPVNTALTAGGSLSRALPENTHVFPNAAEVPSPATAAGVQTQNVIPAPAVSSLPAVPAAALSAVPPVPAYVPAPPAEIKGALPPAGSAGLYRLQIGAYSVPRNAVDAFDKLKNAGLNPAYEKYGEYYRVVLAGLNAADLPQIAQRLGNAGFREVIIREE